MMGQYSSNKSSYAGRRSNNRSFNNRSNNSWRRDRSRGGRGRFSFNKKRRFSNKGKSIDKSLYTNDLQKEVVEEQLAYVGGKYTDFDFNRIIFNNLKEKGYKNTTEIQAKSIPLILEGKDLLGMSATGSGKTAAFLIPMIEKLLKDRSQRLLIVAPTRELAAQIAKEALSILKGTPLQISLIIGGESMRKQLGKLKRGGDLIVGTPGRINDLINRGSIKANRYNNIVIDEVDRMLDMGFIDDIKFIFQSISQNRQTLFFSATFNEKVERTVASLSSGYETVKLSNNKPSKNVVQSVIDYTTKDEKLLLLQNLLNNKEVLKTLVFVETKRFANEVDKMLHKNEFKVGAIHGDKRQNVRKRVIDMFKKSKIDVLVATNVAARGLDIDDITHVINLDEPQSYDEYIHRIGRTGRNGSLGTAFTFVRK